MGDQVEIERVSGLVDLEAVDTLEAPGIVHIFHVGVVKVLMVKRFVAFL